MPHQLMVPRPHRVRRVVSALCLALLGVGVADASPAAAVDRGVDTTGYCKATYAMEGVGVSAWHQWAGSWTAVTWRCRRSALWPVAGQFASIFRPAAGVKYSADYEIDVNAACRWQYGTGSYAKLLGQSWSDWRCVT